MNQEFLHQLSNKTDLLGRELKNRVLRDSLDEILERWDLDGEGEFQWFLAQWFNIKWLEYVSMN